MELRAHRAVIAALRPMRDLARSALPPLPGITEAESRELVLVGLVVGAAVFGPGHRFAGFVDVGWGLLLFRFGRVGGGVAKGSFHAVAERHSALRDGDGGMLIVGRLERKGGAFLLPDVRWASSGMSQPLR